MEVSYRIPPAGNLVFLAAFAALIPINIFNGIRHKTPVYALLLTAALLLEVVGHVGRLFLSPSSFNNSHFILYMIGTHWGPILVGSAIYMILPHVTVIYGQQFRLVSNGLYLNISFAILDIFALAFQAVGIILTANASTSSHTKQAHAILLSGLSIHAFTLLAFLATYRYFHFKLSHRQYILDARFSHIYLSRRFKYFLIGAQTPTLLLLFRAILRVTSISGPLSKTFFIPEIVTSLSDDTFTLVSLLVLSALPAGRAFANSWAETSPLLSPDALSDLPLRRYFHRHGNHSTKSHQIRKRHISYPYPSNTTAASDSPYSPGRAMGAETGIGMGMGNRSPAELPTCTYTHSGDGSIASPLTSPRHNPVYQRAPYDQPPTQTVPFLTRPIESPTGFLFMNQGSPPTKGFARETGKKKMVERDDLWV
ncbi:hypothetical protein QBC44DRAFT_43342 [Cladorrhinum sp. PSN332]|nr:hypothetical protein QBC44DRAFT_43342 [Cladorrhinum sp. PSN332]